MKIKFDMFFNTSQRRLAFLYTAKKLNAAADFLCVLGYGANNKTLTCVCVVYGEAPFSCALRQRLATATLRKLHSPCATTQHSCQLHIVMLTTACSNKL